MRFRFALGSYTPADRKGIHIVELDLSTGRFRPLHSISGVESPSYLCFDRQRRRLYAVSEKPRDGELVALALNEKDDALTELGRRRTQGAHPCFVATDASGSWLLGVNYMSGSIFVFSADSAAGLGELVSFVPHQGKGIRPDRQEGPHPHSIFNIPSTHLWMVPDLGIDAVVVYELTGEGVLAKRSTLEMTPGAGPRHVAFHPTLPIAYVAQELASTVSVLLYEATTGRLERIQSDVRALPDGYSGASQAADIHLSPDGTLLYASNRGSDTIATFRIEPDGLLRPVAHTATGRTPRNFFVVPDSGDLLVAAQDDNCIQLFECDESGIPARLKGLYRMNRPSCIVML